MASVWKRLQRVNKRAAKFQYTASYHRIDLETTPKWKPNKLSIVWTRRSRRVVTEPQDWEPSLKDPLKGSVIFTLPVNHTVAVTLFKDSRTNELEDKDWTFVLEDVSPSGKRRRVASCHVNMRKYASLEPSQRPLTLPLDVHGTRLTAAALTLTLHCVLLREGPATDEDMQSLASMLSVNNNSDIAVLEDLDEDDYTLSDHSTKQMLDLRQQMEEMTQSLTNSDIAATPNSVQSLKFDSRTPTAPLTPASPATPVPEDNDYRMDFRSSFENKNDMSDSKQEPKFTSTPKLEDGFKALVLKPRTIAKRNLKPLELKGNLNSIGLDNNDNESEDTDKTPTAETERMHSVLPSANDKDRTPVAELLWWCRGVTREYRACRVADLASFRSGLAFCAIIHRYRPELIDYSGLQPDDAEKNLRIALDASAALGLPPVMCAADVLKPAPDRLAIMTYLFQLRAYFTGNELHVEQLGNDETESSYLVGRHDTDGSMPRELFSREVSARRSRNVIDRPRPQLQDSQPPPSPDKAKDLLHQSRAILGKVLSPAKELKSTAKWFAPIKLQEPPPIRPEKLMTRKELTDPFGSDDEDDDHGRDHDQGHDHDHDQGHDHDHDVNNHDQTPPELGHRGNGLSPKSEQKPSIEPALTDPLTTTENHTTVDVQTDDRPQPADVQNQTDKKSSTPELPKPTPQLLSRHDELKERARQLLEATKREAREKDRIKKQNSKEKEAEAAKENGLLNGENSPKKPMTEEERQAMLRERARKLIADARAGIVSPTSPLSPSRVRGPTLEIITKQSLMDEIAAAGGELDCQSLASPSSRGSSASPDRSGGGQRVDGDDDDGGDGPCDVLQHESGSYIQSELCALEREQSSVDERAAALEIQLRRVMESADDTHEEDRLMSQWFNLVNKKNALLRRQMQLNILEQEEDLSRRCELLARELRLSLGVDEWRKTPGQKRRERLLLQELLSAVNERDRLVQEMDEQEKAIADDDAIERNLSQVEIQRKNNCILQ